jgi:hypothetical protein
VLTRWLVCGTLAQVSFGERMSVRIMAARLNQIGVPAQFFESWTLGLRTTSEFGRAEVLPGSYEAIKSTIKKLDDSMCVAVALLWGCRAVLCCAARVLPPCPAGDQQGVHHSPTLPSLLTLPQGAGGDGLHRARQPGAHHDAGKGGVGPDGVHPGRGGGRGRDPGLEGRKW